MKKHLKNLNRILALAAVCLLPGSAFGTTTAETNAAPAEVVVPKSIFVDDPKIGRDPFYPKSTRRTEKVAPGQPVLAPITQLSLKGISGPANRRFALINNQTIGVGETASVRVGLGLVKVRCWEINESSVVISMEGNPEKKELRLRGS